MRLGLLLLLLTVGFYDRPTVISIAFSEWERRSFGDAFFAGFERDHSGVKIVFTGSAIPQPDINNMPSYLDRFKVYASGADVLLVSSDSLAKEAIDAGYLLDLQPLIDAGASTLFSYQGGVWAQPLALDALVIGYDAARFDAAGLAYPDEHWTLDNYANAVRVLTLREGGSPAFSTIYTESMLQSLTRAGNTLETTSLTEFYTAFPEFEDINRRWSNLEREGRITDQGDAPLQIVNLASETDLQIASFPQRLTRVSAFGLALSAGTQHPELAYELIEYIVSDPKTAEVFEGVADLGEATPLPFADVLLLPYLAEARREFALTGNNLTAAVDRIDALLAQNETLARQQRQPFVVQPQTIPVNEPSVLRFGLINDLSVRTTVNRSQWDRVIAEFVAANPDVTGVDIDSPYPSPFETSTDCFYYFGGVSSIPPARLNLDPLMAADADFDEEDFVLGTLDQVRVEGRLWGYPLTITPYAVWYNETLFQEAGIPFPQNGWTMTDFENTLILLEEHTGGEPVLLLRDYVNKMDKLILMAAYGALPVDGRTEPATRNLTDPDTVQIMRRVLDDIKRGRFNTSFLDIDFVDTALNGIPLYIDRLSWETLATPYTPVMIPIGEKYAPVSHMIGTAYISTQANNPEACYRWIQTLAKHPELFFAMPARRSQIENLAAAHGENLVSFYRDYLSVIDVPNAVSIRPSDADLALHQIFQDYLFTEGVDLSQRLADLEVLLVEFYACVDAIEQPSYNPLVDDGATYMEAYLACNPPGFKR